MKPIVAIVVFFSFLLPSLFLGYTNFVTAKERIIADVNQALVKTVLQDKPERITADTLRVFKSNLRISSLKATSYLALCTEEPSKLSFCSDTVSFKTGGERLYIRAYPNCSTATIFRLSEQGLPITLLSMAVLWGLFSLAYLRRRRFGLMSTAPAVQMEVFGNLSFSTSTGLFYNEASEEIYFTPMQRLFMQALMTSERKRVSVEELCATLWPRKDNARETLYTLVRRLKPIVERNCNLRVVADKGGYSLAIRTDDGQ